MCVINARVATTAAPPGRYTSFVPFFHVIGASARHISRASRAPSAPASGSVLYPSTHTHTHICNYYYNNIMYPDVTMCATVHTQCEHVILIYNTYLRGLRPEYYRWTSFGRTRIVRGRPNFEITAEIAYKRTKRNTVL